jgi:magnesium chelatase accessory protein
MEQATTPRDVPLENEHSRRIERGRVRWHVQVRGSGPVILLVHGTGASSHSFRALMPLLEGRFTIVAPDLPGHALSAASAQFVPTLPATAAALADLLDALGVDPIAAVGHSAGAAIVVQMALEGLLRPRRLVGLAAALMPFRGIAKDLSRAAARGMARSELVSTLIAWRARDRRSVDQVLASTGSALDAEGLAFYGAIAQRPEHVASVLSMMANWDVEPLFGALGRLEAPLLLLAGDRDRAVPIAQQRMIAARAPRARVVVVDRAGHLLHEERPPEVARHILDELAS